MIMMGTSTRLAIIATMLSFFHSHLCYGLKVPVSLRRVSRYGQVGQMLGSNVSITNREAIAYLAKINLGGQDFSLLLDSGSADLWVVSSDCSSPDCDAIQKYNKTPSLNLTSWPFNLKYLIGSVSGTVGFETLDLGGYEISSQAFALADHATGLQLGSTGYSGILGLSFPASASIEANLGTDLLTNLFSTFGNDSEKFYAYKLGREPDVTDWVSSDTSPSTPTSSFSVGELDDRFSNSTSDFWTSPVHPRTDGTYDYWKLPLQYITINSLQLPLSASRLPGTAYPIAVLDTGTTLILGPSRDIENFWESIGDGAAGNITRKNRAGEWEVRCERGVTVGFVLGDGGGWEWVIDPRDVSWKDGDEDGWCLGGIQANDGIYSADWVLGDAFLRNFYVMHHLATTSSPPHIGLLNLTNSESAMATFQQERGKDSASGVHIRVPELRGHSKITPTVLYAMCWAIGAVGGSFATLLYRGIRM